MGVQFYKKKVFILFFVLFCFVLFCFVLFCFIFTFINDFRDELPTARLCLGLALESGEAVNTCRLALHELCPLWLVRVNKLAATVAVQLTTSLPPPPLLVNAGSCCCVTAAAHLERYTNLAVASTDKALRLCNLVESRATC
jgi:hypothetical protein